MARVVGIACDYRQLGKHPFHIVGEKYITAIREGARAVPLLIPVLSPPVLAEDLLASVDGLLFTGSPSNVAPSHYGGPAPRQGVLQDERRDATTLPLLKAAIAAGLPTLCICRGFQELNVAFGGTLHQHVVEVPGRADHRESAAASLDEQYAPVHEVSVIEDGFLATLTPQRTFQVNSLHSQGIDRLAPGLRADAVAPDGTIEAVSIPGAKAFLLGVQWHPEWRWSEDPVSRSIFAGFGTALDGE